MSKIKSGKIDIGNNIKTIIDDKKIKRTEIIREMQLQGISINSQRLYKIEHNIAIITADELLAIAEILEITVEDLLKKG